MTEVISAFIGASAVLLALYFGQNWTRQTRMESEIRQARREERRQAIAPVSRFLDMAARANAARFTASSLKTLYDSNLGGIKDKMTFEKFRDFALSDIEQPPTNVTMAHEFMAAATTVPTQEMWMALFVVWSWVGEESSGSSEKLRKAIQEARGLVEDHIVEDLALAPSDSFTNSLRRVLRRAR